MKKKLFKYLLSIFLLFIITVFFIGLNKSSIYDTKGLAGDKINDIKLNHFNGIKFITDADLKKNDFTLINFWASWCGPCRSEHTFLIQLQKEKNLKLLGVNFKDKKNKALEFLEELGNPYDLIAIDELGKQSVNFGIYGIPESIIINNNLVVLKKFIGPLNETDLKMIKKIVEKK